MKASGVLSCLSPDPSRPTRVSSYPSLTAPAQTYALREQEAQRVENLF